MSETDTGAGELRIIIIGAGVSGILAAIRLQQEGYRNFVVFEKEHRIGGTWRDNTYPGVACDIPSHLYCYSFAPNPEWSRQYAPGAEIQQYLERVVRDFNIERHIRFGEEVTRCEFSNARWHIETRSGHWDVADVLIVATGVTHQPHIPELPGLASFGGTAFHSARWNHHATIDGTRVGVIGTGSSAVQIVSAVTSRAARLKLFQRTPQWIMPQEGVTYSDEDRAQFRAHPETLAHMRRSIERRFVENFSDAVIDVHSPRLQAIEKMCLDYLEAQVPDSALRERLRPNYRAACKRLVVSSDFYQAIQQPNAELITNGIEAVEPQGIRTQDGELHALDVLILATGFRTNAFIRPAQVVGTDGRTLEHAWTPRPTAYLCVAVPSFPNFFMLNGPNGPVGNYPLIEVAELQMNYVLQLIDLLRRQQCRTISPSHVSTQAFEAERVAATKNTVWTTGCHSWYLDKDGVPASWPWPISRFREQMAQPKLEAYDLGY